MNYKRIFLIVMDSLGVGELEDAKQYGDEGCNTIRSIANAHDLSIKNLQSLGFGNILNIKGVEPVENPKGYYTKLKELSKGKDTMTGHYEIMGLKVTKPYKTFTDTGFPKELIDELEKRTNRKVVGNVSASGTEIIKQYGEHQMKTGDLIVYTSADSVLQIAAHEEIIPIDELYKICEIARDITMKEQWKVGRIIARPYVGDSKDTFKRTSNRHDYALKPFDKTVLDDLKEAGKDVISVGKINDIYDTQGITEAYKSVSNEDGMNITIKLTQKDFNGLAFVNLVDFDALYGHRRDAKGYGKCLDEFDVQLGQLMDSLKDDDLLILTADHGTDPSYKGSDHTREHIPLLVYNKNFKQCKGLEVGESFANIGATIAENFNVKQPKIGESYLSILR